MFQFPTQKSDWSQEQHLTPRPLFTKRTDVLPQNPVKSRSREIRV